MGTINSGSATKDRARNLAKQIGADHLDVKVDIVIDAMAKLFEMITGKTPRSRVRLSSPPRPHPPKIDHLDVKVDIVIDAMAKLFEMITGKTPRFLGKALKFQFGLA